VPGGGPPPPYPAITAAVEVTAATAAAAAAAANQSGPPVTAVWVALGTTMTRERAGVSEAAAGGRRRRPPLYPHRCRVCHWRTCRRQPVGAGGLPGGVLALTAVLVALPLPPLADGAASRPPP